MALAVGRSVIEQRGRILRKRLKIQVTLVKVNIAIVDTGVDSTHEAFAGKLVWAYDATLATPRLGEHSQQTMTPTGMVRMSPVLP